MAYIETWSKQEMTKPVKVQYLGGNLFSQDSQGNLLGVELFKDGVAYSGGGTVSGTVIRADGGTVAVTGSISGNKAQIILPAAAYAVVGAVTIIIKLTQGGQTATVGAFVSMVYATSTDTIVDPGTIIPSIADLIAQIQAAVGSIPADYSALNQEVDDLKSAIAQRGIPSGGASGQSLRKRSGTDYDLEWASVGLPTDAQTVAAVAEWLDNHPEATTTVQNNSLTHEKLVLGTLDFITPEMFGAVGDGVTDDTLPLQQAITYALNNGYNFRARPTKYSVTQSIEIITASEAQKNVTLDFCGCELNVANDIDYVVRVMTSDSGFGLDTARWIRRIENLIINANERSNIGIMHTMGRNVWYENIAINDVKQCGLKADGGVKIDKISINKNLDTFDNYPTITGIILNATDNKLTHIRIRDANKGIEINGAANYIYDMHCWLISPLTLNGSIAFDINSGLNNFFGCYADTYETGWDFLDNDNNQSLIGCTFYPNPSFYNDNTDTTIPTVFKFKSYNGANERVATVGFIIDSYPYYAETGKKVLFSNYSSNDLDGSHYAIYNAYNKGFSNSSMTGLPVNANTIIETIKNLNMVSHSFITEDLNDYVTQGFYGVFRNSSLNFPSVCGYYCWLMVLKSSSGDITQVAISARTGFAISIRTYDAINLSWGRWSNDEVYAPTPTSSDETIVGGGYTVDANGMVTLSLRFRIASGTDNILFTGFPKTKNSMNIYTVICTATATPSQKLAILNDSGLLVFGGGTLSAGEYVVSATYMSR